MNFQFLFPFPTHPFFSLCHFLFMSLCPGISLPLLSFSLYVFPLSFSFFSPFSLPPALPLSPDFFSFSVFLRLFAVSSFSLPLSLFSLSHLSDVFFSFPVFLLPFLIFPVASALPHAPPLSGVCRVQTGVWCLQGAVHLTVHHLVLVGHSLMKEAFPSVY